MFTTSTTHNARRHISSSSSSLLYRTLHASRRNYSNGSERSAPSMPAMPSIPIETQNFVKFEKEYFMKKGFGEFPAHVRSKSVPGPKGAKALKAMNAMQDFANTTIMPVNYLKSCGNFICDADNNIFLDMYSQISSIPTGYNQPDLLRAIKTQAFATAFANRPALGVHPPHDYAKTLENGIMKLAPKGLDMVVTLSTGAEATENAFKLAFIRYAALTRGGDIDLTEEMSQSAMRHEEPGTPQLSILSFSAGFHGRTLGALTATRSKAIHKIGFPAFPWPVAEFPRLKYPLEEHAAENRREENRCLTLVTDIIRRQRSSSPVAGVIVEPIQSEGGDYHASPYFFQKLQKICQENDVSFIVDEVQTGGGSTGTFWTHEQWNLDTPPDMVCFSKKLQAAGVYYRSEFRPPQPFRIFSTWLGDPLRALQVGLLAKHVEEGKLIDNVRITGRYLYDGLYALQDEFPALMSNVRGVGTFCAFDLPSGTEVTEFKTKMLRAGVVVGSCGTNSIRFRPMLIFTPEHCQRYLHIMRGVLQAMNEKGG